MIYRGIVIGFNSYTNMATVEVNGNIIQSENYLGNSIDLSKDFANSFLPSSQHYTVLPVKNLKTGDFVVLSDMNGTSATPVILGIVSTPETITTTQPPVVYLPPGYFEILKDFSTTNAGLYNLELFAEKALVNKIKIINPLETPFIIKIFNTSGELQASWGDGDIQIETGVLEDYAGFFFKNNSGSTAKIEITPPGNYQIEIAGWRFS